MAEITKITTPMVPKENTGVKLRPVSDQAFELTDPSKVHKGENEGKTMERQPDSTSLQREAMGRAAIVPLLKNMGDISQVFKRIALLVEMGVSASDVAKDAQVKELLSSLFVSSPKEFMKALMEQDGSSVMFKGEAFDLLRNILDQFKGSPKIKDSIANLLKAFDQNVNTQNSIKTILYNCSNLLDYMFSKDKAQFSNYLKGLAEMLLPGEDAEKLTSTLPKSETAQNAAANTANTAVNNPNGQQVQATAEKGALPENTQQAVDEPENQQVKTAQTPENAKTEQKDGQSNSQVKPADSQPLSQKETAQLLKNNLLPLLGEIVVKYNQNPRIRDIVMVIVHNIVRVDQGTDESLEAAVAKLARDLKQFAGLPENFEKNLLEMVKSNVTQAKEAPNTVLSKLSDIIEDTLRSTQANPSIVRQAENMLVSVIQNQSPLMDVLHFMLPFETPQGHVFTELYVDPETQESAGKQQGKSRKIFLSIESEAHGSFELSFLETGEHIDFSMWCPENLVTPLSGLKRQFSNIMQTHGYTMNNFQIDEMRAPHSVAEVFPRLLEKKVGIDVSI